MIMNATHLYGPDDQPRKKSLMAPLVQTLLVGITMVSVLTALVAVLRYGTEGHSLAGVRSAKLLRTSRFCPHAYRVAVWCSRHNILGLRHFW